MDVIVFTYIAPNLINYVFHLASSDNLHKDTYNQRK